MYLKNIIMKNWKERDSSELDEGEQPFCIAEQSKIIIRERIVDAIIQSPLTIRLDNSFLSPSNNPYLTPFQ